MIDRGLCSNCWLRSRVARFRRRRRRTSCRRIIHFSLHYSLLDYDTPQPMNDARTRLIRLLAEVRTTRQVDLRITCHVDVRITCHVDGRTRRRQVLRGR